MSILVWLLTCLIPVVIAPGILFHYDITPKIAILALAAAMALASPRAVADRATVLWKSGSGRWLCVLALAQILWLAVTTAFSSRPYFSLFGSSWRRMGLLSLCALVVFVLTATAHFFQNPRQIKITLRAFALAAIVASIYGIAQYFDIDPLQNASAYHAQAGDSLIVRPPGTLGHADYFGWWLAIALFCSVGLARVELGAWRWAARSASVLSAAAVVLSGTRSAMVAVIAGFICFAVLTGFKFQRKHAAAALLCVALLTAFYVSPAGVRARARVKWSADEPLGGARPLLWRDSLRMAAARPFAGFGLETFAAEFPRYESVELAQLFPDYFHESPHNAALDVLTSEGFPGVLIAVGWMLLGGYAALRARRNEAAFGAAMTSALVASCVAGIFGVVTIGPLFATAVVLAILIALDQHDTGARVAFRPSVLMAFSVPLALCLAGYAILLTVADFNLQRFQRVAARAGDAKIIAAYDAVTRTALPGGADDLYCSRQLSLRCAAMRDPGIRAACAHSATQAAGRATLTADNPPNAWYNLAMFAAGQNDARGVEIALRTSAQQAPNWYKPHWALANLLVLNGRIEEARKEADRAALLNAGKDAEVAQTLRAVTNQPR